jgi:hypothetical protein
MVTDRAAGGGACSGMLACHMTDDGTGNRTLAAARMGGSGNEGEDDRGQGEFQFRIHDGSSLC